MSAASRHDREPIARNTGLSIVLVLAAGALVVARETGALAAAAGDFDPTLPVAPGHWMAWTWAGVMFFGAIACALIGMTIWQSLRPQQPRVGVLGLETTPGDRLFISLLGSAFIHLGWLAAFGAPLWSALALSLVYAAAVFRWV
jgi:predicted small integral membrane protein